MSADEIQSAIRSGSVPTVRSQKEAFDIARRGGWEADALCESLDQELTARGDKRGPLDLDFANPKHFTWLLVAFASMGGLLSGLDQSLISGANLFLPTDLGLTTRQNSLVNSGMPLGAVGGALILSPCNEWFGRRWSILISCMLYTIGAALEAGSIDYGMIVAARVILGFGVGLEVSTNRDPCSSRRNTDSHPRAVPFPCTSLRRLRGDCEAIWCRFTNSTLPSAKSSAMLLRPCSCPSLATGDTSWAPPWSSAPVSTRPNKRCRALLTNDAVMGIGMLFMPESPRFLMHKGKVLDAFKVWKRIRGTASVESREEFFIMKVSTEEEEAEVAAGAGSRRFPWLDFFTKPRARRAIVYANIMIFLGQFTGINAIMYYMSVLMNQIGFNSFEANYMSLVGGGSLLLGTIPAIFLMETCGRRFWACATLPGFFVGLVLVGVSYNLHGTVPKEGVYLTGLIIYELFFGSYACLTWVIPSEVYPTYLRSYGMTTSDGWLFLSSFIVTYNFSAMQNAMTKTGLALGFYGGIAVIGWFYQIFFMPETKDKTLEEIDLIFQRPTMEIVRENMASARETTNDLLHFRLKKVFIDGHTPRRASIVDPGKTAP